MGVGGAGPSPGSLLGSQGSIPPHPSKKPSSRPRPQPGLPGREQGRQGTETDMDGPEVTQPSGAALRPPAPPSLQGPTVLLEV